MSLLQTTTYKEELYQIHTKALVIISKPWKEVSEEERTLLNKILGSVRLSLAAVQVVTMPFFSESELAMLDAPRIIAFGTKPATALPLYELTAYPSFSLIVADDLTQLDDAKKKNLWLALKKMFGV